MGWSNMAEEETQEEEKKEDINSFSSGDNCEKCSSNDDVVDCPQFNAAVCRSCCNKCPILRKCPIRNSDGS